MDLTVYLTKSGELWQSFKGYAYFYNDFQAEGNLCLFEAGYYLSINLRLINILPRLRVVTKISFF